MATAEDNPQTSDIYGDSDEERAVIVAISGRGRTYFRVFTSDKVRACDLLERAAKAQARGTKESLERALSRLVRPS